MSLGKKFFAQHSIAFSTFFKWSGDNHRQAIMFYILILLQAVLETGALAVVFPYIQFLESGNFEFFNLLTLEQPNMAGVTSSVCCIVFFIAALRYLILQRVVRFAYFQEMYLSNLVVKKLLHFPYEKFHRLKKDDMYRLVATEIPQAVNAYFVSVIYMLMSFLSILLISIMLLIVNIQMTGIALGVLSILYSTVVISKNKNITALGKDRLRLNSEKFSIFSEILEAFKAIKLNGQAALVEQDYHKMSHNYASVHSRIQFATLSPKVIIEGCITLILIIGGYLYVNVSITQIVTLPELLFFAVASVKMLPHFQMVYARWASANYSVPTVLNVYEQLKNLDIKNDKDRQYAPKIGLQTQPGPVQTLELSSINYKVENDEILKSVNYTFKKGYVNVISGPSGSGKTTMLNIISGLLLPSSGAITVNGHDVTLYENELWFNNISYVDQFPFFTETTVSSLLEYNMQNISGQETEFDKESYKKLGLESEFYLDQPIYQGGINFSGGQRQRMAFLSILLRQEQVVLLDEVTSGLDEKNEQIIWNMIEKLSKNKLVIMISHKKLNLQTDKVRYFKLG